MSTQSDSLAATQDVPESRLAAVVRVAAQPAHLALGAVLLVGLVLRVVFWYGIVNVDPYAYADGAASIARGLPVYHPDIVGSIYFTQYVRLSLVVPAAALYWLFGPGEVVSTLFPIGCSLGIGVVAYFLAKRAADARAGVFAAFLAVIFPLNVINSTQFLPDTVMAFFSGLTMLLFLLAFEDERSRRDRALLYFAAGASWALAFYGRPTTVALAIPFGALVLLNWRFHLEWLAGVAGAFLVVGLMNVLMLSLGGEFLIDVRTILTEGRGSQPGALGYTDIDLTYARDLVRDPMFVPTTLLAALGLVVSVAKLGWRGLVRSRLFAIVLLAVGQYIYFEQMMRLPGLYSWWKEPRYILSMMIPLFVLAGVGLSHWIALVSPRARYATAGYALGGLLFAGVVSVDTIRDDIAYWEKNRVDLLAAETARFLNSAGADAVYVWNDDFARYMSPTIGLDRTTYFERDQNRGVLRDRFVGDMRSNVQPGSYVVLLEGTNVWTKNTVAAPHWELAWEKPGKVQVFRVPETPVLPADATFEPVVAAFSEGKVSSAALSKSWAVPQEHIAVALGLERPLETPVSVTFATRCEAEPNAPLREHERTLAAGQQVVTVDLPVDTLASATTCEMLLRTRDGDWAALGRVQVPLILAVEPESQFTFDPDFERNKQSGWARVAQPFYSGGSAAVAIEPNRPLPLPIDHVPVGDYWADVAVYDYGTPGQNEAVLRLNGVETPFRWGGAEAPGVVHIMVPLAGVPAGGDFKLEISRRAQDGIVVDSVVLTDVNPSAGSSSPAPR